MVSRFVLALGLLAAQPAEGPDTTLRRIVADYVGLYRQESLPEWRQLFLESFSVASTNADGSVRLRSLDEFYLAQERYLSSGRAIREVLENVRIERRGRLATAWADFVLTDNDVTSRGKLCLLLIAERGRWRIQSLVFAYDDAN